MTPDTRLDDLIPPDQRRTAWDSMRADGLRVPDLMLSPSGQRVWGLATLAGLVLIQLATGWWWLTALAVVVVCYFGDRASRPWAVHLPPCPTTVGELVVYGTRFRDHSYSGYQWSHGDIALKVRLIVAESAGLPLEAIQTDTKFVDLD